MPLPQIDEYPDDSDDVPPLFPPRLARCLRRMAILTGVLAVVGWLVWGVWSPDVAVWVHASSLAIGLALPLFVSLNF